MSSINSDKKTLLVIDLDLEIQVGLVGSHRVLEACLNNILQ